jgi:hypothetical protein
LGELIDARASGSLRPGLKLAVFIAATLPAHPPNPRCALSPNIRKEESTWHKAGRQAADFDWQI